MSVGDELLGVGHSFHSGLLSNHEDLLAAVDFLQVVLERGEFDPGVRQVREHRAVLLVDHTHPIELAKMLLHLDVGLENLLLGTHTPIARP